MVYSYYTPTYYSTLHDSITSLCKTILPFSFKKRPLPAAEHKLSKLQSDNLKWQQDSFHQVLNLMGLHKEGIVAESEVSAFRIHLLDTLIVSPPEQEHPVILRDKLLFLQELLYAKCISEEEYHSSKRPLLQRLAAQGAQIEARDVIVAKTKESKENFLQELLYAKCISEEEYHSSKRPLLQRLAAQGAQIEARDVIVAKTKESKENLEEEWSVIDLKDEKCSVNKENLGCKSRSNQGSSMKQIKGAASVFGFGRAGKNGTEKSIFDSPSLSAKNENPFWDGQTKGARSEGGSILMEESEPPEAVKESSGLEKLKRKPFRSLFHKEQKETHGGGAEQDQRSGKSVKKQWGFEGFKKWKRNESEDETCSLSHNERSDNEAFSGPFAKGFGEGPDTKLMKKKLHSDGSPSDFFIDKVLGDNIKKELSRIQTELSSTNPHLKFSNDQIEAISTRIPVDKAELKNYFPKSWCDRYGDVVLDVVKKEFKDHVAEMENMRTVARERHSNSRRWTTTTFDNDENIHPNPFGHRENSVRSSNINPFSHGFA